MNVVRNVIWNVRLHGWNYAKKYAGIAAAVGSVSCVCGFAIYKTKHDLNKIVAICVLEREYSARPEYLYVNDPAYEERIRQHLENEDTWSPGPILGRWVGSFRRAIWRRLIHISRNGSVSDRHKALLHLAAIKHLKEWEWTWLIQRLDARSAVWLARHGGGCGGRLSSEMPPLPASINNVSFLPILFNLAAIKQPSRKCRCLEIFLQDHKYQNQDVHRIIEQETGSGENKQVDENSDLLSYLETTLHHLDMSPINDDESIVSGEEVFINSGGLVFVNKAARSPERPLQLAAARLLLKLSQKSEFLPIFHRAGIVTILSKWIEDDSKKNAELHCMSSGILASLDDGANEEKIIKEIYGPAVQLLHPNHHSLTPPKLDVVFVHGLLGEPFITWRQRDKKESAKELNKKDIETEINILDDFKWKGKFDVILRDIPEDSLRDSSQTNLIHRDDLEISFNEVEDLTSHTQCWPRDWLPNDCPDIRVLAVSYDTMMIEWSSNCKGLGDTEGRAYIIGAALEKAGVGSRPIVWVAHSMGGLLIKHMLVKSFESKDEKDRGIAKNTKGIVFFSTPHHGSKACHTLIWPSKEVKDLRQDSKILGVLHQKWLAGGWNSVCIAENRTTHLFPGLWLHLVPPDSANDNSGPFYVLPLDHLDICKPATRYSFIYRIVVEMIQHAKGEKCCKEGCVRCAETENKSAFQYYLENAANSIHFLRNKLTNRHDNVHPISNESD